MIRHKTASPMIFRKESGTIFEPEVHACPLGMFGGQEYSCHDMKIEPGDCVVLFTDGVTEAFNADNEEFGEERLRSAVLSHARNDPRALTD